MEAKFSVLMDGSKSLVKSRPARSDTEIKTETEIVEEFFAVMESRSEKSSELKPKSNKDVPALMRCRICAIPNDDMVDMFTKSDETAEDILEMINHCLPIVVRETDKLPKQACLLCLRELKCCYEFRKIAAEAEKQLLAYNRQSSEEYDALAHDNVEKTLNTFPDMETDNIDLKTIAREERTTELTAESSVAPTRLNACTVVPIETQCTIKITKDKRKSSSDDEYIDVVGSGEETSVSHIGPQTTSESGVFRATHRTSRAEKKGNSSINPENKSENIEPPVNHTSAAISRGRYECNSCKKTFKFKQYLARHIKYYSRRLRYSCRYCEKKFSSTKSRDLHHPIHTSKRPFKCTTCGIGFTQLPALKRHTQKHSKNRDYKCTMCDKAFKYPESKSRHLRIHTGEKPWQCDDCKKNFQRKKHLRQHLLTCPKRRESG